jgi:hypothetical protein
VGGLRKLLCVSVYFWKKTEHIYSMNSFKLVFGNSIIWINFIISIFLNKYIFWYFIIFVNKRRIYKLGWVGSHIAVRTGCANKRRIYKWNWRVRKWNCLRYLLYVSLYFWKKQSIYIRSILLSWFLGIRYREGFWEFAHIYLEPEKLIFFYLFSSIFIT